MTRNDLRDINTDLLTRESIADMMASLTESGILCFHISHRYHNLEPPIVDAAASLQLSWKVGKDTHYDKSGKGRPSHYNSVWVMIARRERYLRHLTDVDTKDQHLEWTIPETTGKRLWRDGQEHDLTPLAWPKK